jgi:transposase
MGGKTCPMCGTGMRLREQQITTRVPGTSETRSAQQREWVCPECDYFEEAED